MNAVAPALRNIAKTRPYLSDELLAHAVAPDAVADIVTYLVSDAAPDQRRGRAGLRRLSITPVSSYV